VFTIYCICSIICYHYYYYLYLHVDLNTYCQSKVCMLLRIFILTWDMLADLYAFIYRYIVNLLWYIYRCTWRCLVSTLVCVEFQSCALLSVFMFAICKNSDRRNINWDLDTVTNYMKTLTYFPWDFPLCPLDFPLERSMLCISGWSMSGAVNKQTGAYASSRLGSWRRATCRLLEHGRRVRCHGVPTVMK